MSLKIKDLYALTDEQVQQRHDEASEHTVVGTDYWMKELERRWREKSDRVNGRLARASFILSAVSVVIAIGALFITR